MTDDLRDAARRALLETAILAQLRDANTETRHELDSMEPGDRIGAGDLGHVLKTKPRKGWQVVDWNALAKWVEANAPDQIITITQISPTFLDRIRQSGEWPDHNGELQTPDGIGVTSSAPQLRVSPSDVAHEAARAILNVAQRELER